MSDSAAATKTKTKAPRALKATKEPKEVKPKTVKAAKSPKPKKEPKAPKEPKATKVTKKPKAIKVVLDGSEPVNEQVNETVDESGSVETSEKKTKVPKKIVDPDFIIPIAHIKKYISKFRINKEINELIQQVKKYQNIEKETGVVTELSEFLHQDVLDRIDTFKNGLSADAKAKIEAKSQFQQAVHALSIFKHKFSGNAFAIVSYVLNMVAKEIVIHTLEKTVEAERRSLCPKHIPWELLKNKMMSGVYINTKQVIDTIEVLKNQETKEETVEEVEEVEAEEVVEDDDNNSTQDESSTDSASVEVKLAKYNMIHFLHKLCKYVIDSDERFTKFKINATFTKLCNSILIEVMERYIKMIYILVNISNNKTINDKILLAITKIMIEDNIYSSEADQDTLYQLVESKMETMKPIKKDKKTKDSEE